MILFSPICEKPMINLKNVFCSFVYRVCLNRENDLTKIIQNMIKVHDGMIEEINANHEKEVRLLKAKIQTLTNMLDSNDSTELTEQKEDNSNQ